MSQPKNKVETENTNSLRGMKCPKCRALEPFEIVVTMTVLMYDYGSQGQNGEQEWDDESQCRCKSCGHEGVVGDFRKGALTEEELVSLGYQFNDDPDTPGHTYFIDVLGQGSESFYDKSDAIRAAATQAKTSMELSRCDNCGKVHTEEGLDYAMDQYERTEPGGIIPSGQCVSCGSLCYPIT